MKWGPMPHLAADCGSKETEQVKDVEDRLLKIRANGMQGERSHWREVGRTSIVSHWPLGSSFICPRGEFPRQLPRLFLVRISYVFRDRRNNKA